MISFENVDFSYDHAKILNSVSLDMEDGSFQFLTGPSGAGKTTFLRMCYFDLLPQSGEVTVMGQKSHMLQRHAVPNMRRRIGIIHQDCQFLDHLSLTENIALPLWVSNTDPSAYEENIRQLLDWVGLSDRSDAKPPELSGGERQRAALARAVIMSPDIIIADEPTGNIDWEMGQKILSLLMELNRLGKTVIVATHDLNLIRSTKGHVSARVLRLARGKIEIAGATL